MKVCAVICRKLKFTVSGSAIMLPDANFTSFRAQNRCFCAFLGFETLVFRRFEHKIRVFVRFGASEPPFSGISSTKSRFLCALGQYFLGFRPRRAQNRGFCALFPEKVGFAGCGNLIANSAGVATWLVLLPVVLICLLLLPSLLIWLLLLPGVAICFQHLLGVAI